mmetsp:Transcript_29754/g.70947  ORF Transcript_29754/g.70947 Transcript_29754/m.70947 type:complete len:362 (+) Transcript_29754:185-1270(+)
MTKNASKKNLPEHLEQKRTRVICSDRNYNTETTESASQFMSLGYDNSYSFEKFKQDFKIEIRSIDEESSTMEFDLIGCDPAIANALRRILIAEVPTMAIEHVFFVNNTSIVQDEVLAHRLGLVPLRIDPDKFDFKIAEEAPSEKNTVVMRLKAECKRTADGIVNSAVYSRALEWLPDGSEYPEETSCRFACGQHDLDTKDASGNSVGLRPVHDDILLAKMTPGQVIELEAHCVKGAGKEHAKWSPVATAWYKLKPEVVLLKPVAGELADELVEKCPGLFYMEGTGAGRLVKVDDPLKHPKLLEKVRCMSTEEKWAPYLQLRKLKHHFMFTIESTGVLPPDVLFKQAIDILHSKFTSAIQQL